MAETYTILICDDDPDIVAALDIYLRAGGIPDAAGQKTAARRCSWPKRTTCTCCCWTS